MNRTVRKKLNKPQKKFDFVCVCVGGWICIPFLGFDMFYLNSYIFLSFMNLQTFFTNESTKKYSEILCKSDLNLYGSAYKY